MQATVGAPAAVQHNGSGGHISYQTGYTVTKVTPSGQVTTTRDSDGYERKFNAKGHEMNKLSYGYSLRLDVEAVQAEMNRVRPHRAAADALNNVRLEEQVKHILVARAAIEEAEVKSHAPGSSYTGQAAQWDAQGLPTNIEAALCDTLQWLMHAQNMGCWQKTSNKQLLAATIAHGKRFVGNEQLINKSRHHQNLNPPTEIHNLPMNWLAKHSGSAAAL